MFEEPYRHYVRHQKNRKGNKLRYLVENLTHTRLLRQLESDLSVTLLPETKARLIHRIKEEDAKKYLPEETYEQWYPRLPETAELQKKHKTEDFDLSLRQTLIHELRSAQTETTAAGETATRGAEAEAEAAAEAEIADSSIETDIRTDFIPDAMDTSESDESSDEEADLSDKTSDLASDDELNGDALYARKKARVWDHSFDLVQSWSRKQYTLRKWGLEPLGQNDGEKKYSIRHQHMQSINALLHINIMREKWDLAYKLFCVLVRLKQVDVRLVWPLGVEILLQRRKQLELTGSTSKLDMLKAQSFLEWLMQIYPVFRFNTISHNSNMGPVFRSGSTTHAPMFVVSLLWQLLIERKYLKLRETLDELLMMPPYSSEGLFYLISAYCSLAENIHLASLYSNFDQSPDFPAEDDQLGDLADDIMLIGSKDTIKARILENHTRVRLLLESCDKYNFEYPKDIIKAEIEGIASILKGESDFVSLVDSFKTPEPPKSEFALVNGRVIPHLPGSRAIPPQFLSRVICGKSKKAKKQSWVWFWCTLSKDGKDAICDICGQILRRPSSSTILLSRHIKTHGITEESFSDKKISLLKKDVEALLPSQAPPVAENGTPRVLDWSAVTRRKAKNARQKEGRLESSQKSLLEASAAPVGVLPTEEIVSASDNLDADSDHADLNMNMTEDRTTSIEEGNMGQSDEMRQGGKTSAISEQINDTISLVSRTKISPKSSPIPPGSKKSPTSDKHLHSPCLPTADVSNNVFEFPNMGSEEQASPESTQGYDFGKAKSKQSSFVAKYTEGFSMHESLESEEDDLQFFANSKSQFLHQKIFSPDSTFDSRFDEAEVSKNFHEFATQTQRSQKKDNLDGLSEQEDVEAQDHLTSFGFESSRDVTENKDDKSSDLENNFEDANDEMFPNPLEEANPVLSESEDYTDHFDSALESFPKSKQEEMEFDFDFD